MADHRLPLVNLQLVMAGGGDSEPAEKAGVAGLCAEMLTRGSAGKSYLDFSNDLQSRGIGISVEDSEDNTRLHISCTSDQLAYAVDRAVEVLNQPNFDAAEFDRLKEQSIGGLTEQLSRPPAVAERQLNDAVYPNSPLGRAATPATLAAVTLDDVKKWYGSLYLTNRTHKPPFLVISGDVSPDQCAQIGQKLAGWSDLKVKADPLPAADYTLAALPGGSRIIAVDNPHGRQATIRFALRAYDLHTDDKYAGSLAGQILSAGIESRLNKYVRAEKGLTYGCAAFFRPTRHGGLFSGSVDTNVTTAAAAVQAMYKVFSDLKTAEVSPTELHDAQTRVAGGMVMAAQTIDQQATMRVNQILNGYPIDYYDTYAQRLAKVTAAEVKDVMNKYVDEKNFTVVVVAPAAATADQMKPLGDVTVVPMPEGK